MPTLPRISVLLCVFNGQEFLAAAIESILKQTFTDFELLIIDDGSTDRSAEIAESYATQDSRVRVHRKSNTGLTDSLNLGIQLAQGEWIARQDADDVSQPRRLELSIQAVTDASNPVDLVVTNWRVWDGKNPKRLWKHLLIEKASLPCLFSAQKVINFFCHGTFMIRTRTLVSLGGYRPSFRYAQDYDLWFRLWEQGQVALVREPLYWLRVHSNRISQGKGSQQFWFGALAALFSIERRSQPSPLRMGRDSYGALTTLPPDALAARIIRQYRLKSLPLFFSGLLQLRRQNSPEILRLIKAWF